MLKPWGTFSNDESFRRMMFEPHYDDLEIFSAIDVVSTPMKVWNTCNQYDHVLGLMHLYGKLKNTICQVGKYRIGGTSSDLDNNPQHLGME